MTRRIRGLENSAALLVLVLSVSCGPRVPAPVKFEAATEACRYCRMSGSDGRTAAQLVSPREEPAFFDDIGCLEKYMDEHKESVRDAIAFVVDHRTLEWIRADSAIYTRVPGLATPMNSHLIAHASAASRDADPAAAGGVAR